MSNQRFLALPERGYVHQSTVPKDRNKCRWFYPHRWDKSSWNGNNDSKPFSPCLKSRKHCRTPKCISPQVSAWLIIDCLILLCCLVYAGFHHAPSPERCFDCQGIRLYPDSTGHGAEHVRGTRSTWLPAGLLRFRWSPLSIVSTWSRVAWPSLWSRPSECKHALRSDSPFVLTRRKPLASCLHRLFYTQICE